MTHALRFSPATSLRLGPNEPDLQASEIETMTEEQAHFMLLKLRAIVESIDARRQEVKEEKAEALAKGSDTSYFSKAIYRSLHKRQITCEFIAAIKARLRSLHQEKNKPKPKPDKSRTRTHFEHQKVNKKRTTIRHEYIFDRIEQLIGQDMLDQIYRDADSYCLEEMIRWSESNTFDVDRQVFDRYIIGMKKYAEAEL